MTSKATGYTLPLGLTITKNSRYHRSRTRLDCQLMHLSRRLEITCLVVSWNFPFSLIETSFEFLDTIHDVVHVEVLKLYPEATLPDFVSKIEERSNPPL